MIIFKRIEIRNFLSFGNNTTLVELDTGISTLILGENLDADGKDGVQKNGAGKTTILNAVAYALYDKSISSISKERLINSTNASKNTLMEVKLYFSVDDDEYEVYRTRGESYITQILKNGVDITPDSVVAINNKLAEIVGMSYELFTRIVIFKGSDQPFLELPISQQRLQIEELFKITMLSEKANILRERVRELENSIKLEEGMIAASEKLVAAHETRVNDAESRLVNWETERQQTITSHQEKKILLAEVDFTEQKNLLTSYTTVELQLNKIKQANKNTDKELVDANKRLAKVRTEISHLEDDKCPFCLQAFADAGVKLEEKKIEVINLSEKVITLETEVTNNNSAITGLTSDLKLIANQLMFKNMTELMADEMAISMLDERINDQQLAINPYEAVLESLLTEDVPTPNYAKLNELKCSLEHHQFLLKLLTDKNSFIRKKLINRTIPFLNRQINEYTAELGLPHIVEFKPDMSCVVEEYGRQLDFGNLSQGEQKRVNLAISLAFRDVLHQLHNKVNVMFLDEIDGSLDSSGVIAMLKTIKTKARDDGLSMWIISHRPEADGRFDREIIIRKQSGFSNIVYQE